jgi:hypothetical protein
MQPTLKLTDPQLFGNEAAEEEEPEILASYFVSQPGFETFFNPARKLQFVRARKGMGKSALLSMLGHGLRTRDGCIVVSVTGADLVGHASFDTDDPSRLVHEWQRVISRRIALEVGRRLQFASGDIEILMVEAAEVEGFKDRNYLRSLLDRVQVKLAEADIRIERLGMADPAETIRRYANEREGLDIWFLVDDIDSTFINTSSTRLRLGTFFAACRKMAREIRGLKIRASVRSDVWSELRANEDLDKVEQYMTEITWTNDELELILTRRVLAYVRRRHPEILAARGWSVGRDRATIHALVFAPRMPWGKSSAPVIRPLSIFCMRRPRWMAQLCRLAAHEAVRRRRDRIEGTDIIGVMQKFGELRLADLYKEHSHQFEDLRLVVESFAGRRRNYTTEELLDHLKDRYLSTAVRDGVVYLESKAVSGALGLAHFLFKIGFLQGLNHGPNKPDSFTAYEQRPDLLTNMMNPDDGLKWAVHPAYRNVLRIK